MRSRYFDEAGPWSLFIPVTLAVALGVLIADGVGAMIGVVFPQRTVAVHPGEHSPVAGVEPARPDSPPPPGADVVARPALPASRSASPEGQSNDAASPSMPMASAEPMPAASADTGTSPAAEVGGRRLKGPTGARQNGESEACINGTVALRASNGWEQRIDEQQPEVCVATSS